jgi:hypothetical protein
MLKQITSVHDEWTCLCRNTAMDSGFFTCDDTGVEVEPTLQDWDGIHWFCADGGRIIDGNALAVVGQR